MMWGRLAKNIKSRVYPAVAITSVAFMLLLGIGFVLKWWQFEIVPTESETLPAPVSQDAPPILEASPDPLPSATPAPSSSAPSETDASQTATPATTLAAKPDAAEVAARRGSLRVSNQTEHPVRVVLTRFSKSDASQSKTGSSVYTAPAHWDFAPGEGSRRGLLLSLPNLNLKIKKGDVLVAFAQDGSRRYWGPYVVGETPSPVWSSQLAEWQLVLQP